MKSEVIDNILSVEDKADQIIADAQKQSRDIVFQAQAQAVKNVQDAVERERNKGKVDVDTAQSLLNDHLKAYEKQQEKLQKEETVLPLDIASAAADRIVARLLATDLFTE